MVVVKAKKRVVKRPKKRATDRVAEGDAPNVIVIAGPNGAGKSTTARELLAPYFRVPKFVNADTIAQGLSQFDPESVAIAAGRVMWQWLRELAKQRADFAFETTLASRTFAPFIAELKSSGYAFELIFFWLPTADLAIERVRARVRAGGHAIPEDTIRRRHGRGVANFMTLYKPLANAWSVFDNSQRPRATLIARGREGTPDEITDANAWSKFVATATEG